MKIKVCGMVDTQNIRELAALLPDYMGFIFYDQSKRFAQELDEAILSNVPSSIKKTGVFVNASHEDIADKINRFALDAVQLHGDESVDFCGQLQHKGVEVIKAFGIHPDFNFDQLRDYHKVIDFFLFDTMTKHYGGSGKTFDWQLLKKYTLKKPYFLSGGINVDNLIKIQSITSTHLYALDINSGFEIKPGLKDSLKVEQAINFCRGFK